MAIPSDKNSGLPESGREDRGGAADANQASLACLTTYAPGVVLFCGQVYGQLGEFGRRVQALEERFDQFRALVEQQYRRDGEHMALLAACQQDTARVVNHELERHALHPAVEAVVALAEELSHLKDRASQLPDTGDDRDAMNKLRAEIDISCSVAREKLAQLDVQRITPAEGGELDARTHAVCGCVETADGNLVGQISKLVTPGIIYRGKVLRQARVTVFRMRTSDGQNRQKESIWTKEKS